MTSKDWELIIEAIRVIVEPLEARIKVLEEELTNLNRKLFPEDED